MKIKDVKSYVLQYRLEEELGYSQQYYDRRTAHLIEVVTDEGVRGYGEAFGGGNVALASKTIVEQVIGPLIRGMDPLDREVLALRHFEELGNSEVAEVLGIQQKAASIRYVRALRRLKAILSQTPGFSEGA